MCACGPFGPYAFSGKSCSIGDNFMKILVISGFLGAGKTTFIKALAEKTDKKFVVMENEYGEVGIDGVFLASGTGQAEMKVWELTEGCICCTMKADFASSILTISNTLDPEYLVVEPTGLGKLGNILTNISQIQYERIVLLQPVTVLDVPAFDRDKEKYPEICRDQIENAATVIFTKTGALDAEELCRIASEVRAMNPQGEIVTDSCEKKEASWWNGLFERYLTKEGEENAKKREREMLQPDLENAGFTSIHLESGNQLVLFLQGVVSGVFGDIRRAKGYLPAGGAWLRFDVVDRNYSITGYEGGGDSRAVFIGRGIHRRELEEVLCPEEKNLMGKAEKMREVQMRPLLAGK
ncbi:GTP-binding protein [Eisenbergiella tayi]|uniref:GTP-binding protein n=2 Tax=Lachnospiraceae TaxID=186803 RepID=A0A6N7W6I8_9FIRM|nr:GTP-binding protein [Eisenbergiella porci]